MEGNPISYSDPSGHDPYWCEDDKSYPSDADKRQCYLDWNANYGHIPQDKITPEWLDHTTIFTPDDNYSLQYNELKAYAERHSTHQVLASGVNLSLPKVSQYWAYGETGKSACGLFAAAAAGSSDLQQSNILEKVNELYQKAIAKGYYDPEKGIQPHELVLIMQEEFGSSVVENDHWTLGDMYRAIQYGSRVIVDIKIQKIGNHDYSPSGDGELSHFAWVLGMDVDANAIYIQDTASSGENWGEKESIYWTVSLANFWEAWKLPEVSIPIANQGNNPEPVTRWAVSMNSPATK